MSIRGFVLAIVMAGVMLSAMPVGARQSDANATQSKGVGQVSAITLKVTVTISRWEGEKKVASSPYILMVVPS